MSGDGWGTDPNDPGVLALSSVAFGSVDAPAERLVAARVRERFPAGCRVVIARATDRSAFQVGMTGTVSGHRPWSGRGALVVIRLDCGNGTDDTPWQGHKWDREVTPTILARLPEGP